MKRLHGSPTPEKGTAPFPRYQISTSHRILEMKYKCAKSRIYVERATSLPCHSCAVCGEPGAWRCAITGSGVRGDSTCIMPQTTVYYDIIVLEYLEARNTTVQVAGTVLLVLFITSSTGCCSFVRENEYTGTVLTACTIHWQR